MLELNKIHQGDCLERLKEIPDNSVDVILTDPPYNVLALEWDKQEIDWKNLAKELFRVLKYSGCVYIFGQAPFIFGVYQDMIKSNFEFRQDLVWYKNRGFSLTKTIFTKYHENILLFWKTPKLKLKEFGIYIKGKRVKKGISLRKIGELCDEVWYHRGGHMYYETGLACPTKQQYIKLKEVLNLDSRFDNLFDRPTFNFEDIKLDGKPYKITRKAQKIYGVKSNLGEYTQINNGSRNPKTVLEYSIIQGGKEYVGHPTQKPIELLKYLLTASSIKGEIILDPFIGVGSTAIACKQLNRKFIGIEKEKDYVKLANKRLQEVQLPLNVNNQEDGLPPTDKSVGIRPNEL